MAAYNKTRFFLKSPSLHVWCTSLVEREEEKNAVASIGGDRAEMSLCVLSSEKELSFSEKLKLSSQHFVYHILAVLAIHIFGFRWGPLFWETFGFLMTHGLNHIQIDWVNQSIYTYVINDVGASIFT